MIWERDQNSFRVYFKKKKKKKKMRAVVYRTVPPNPSAPPPGLSCFADILLPVIFCFEIIVLCMCPIQLILVVVVLYCVLYIRYFVSYDILLCMIFLCCRPMCFQRSVYFVVVCSSSRCVSSAISWDAL